MRNELFRIGGITSVRGFNEQSIFTSLYSIFTLEYRFNLTTTSYLYSITDYAGFKTLEKQDDAYGLGIGYLLKKGKSQINISTVIGTSNLNSIKFNNSKLNLQFLTFF